MDVERYLQQQNYVSIQQQSTTTDDTTHTKQILESQQQINNNNNNKIHDHKTPVADAAVSSTCDMTEVQCLKQIV